MIKSRCFLFVIPNKQHKAIYMFFFWFPGPSLLRGVHAWEHRVVFLFCYFLILNIFTEHSLLFSTSYFNHLLMDETEEYAICLCHGRGTSFLCLQLLRCTYVSHFTNRIYTSYDATKDNAVKWLSDTNQSLVTEATRSSPAGRYQYSGKFKKKKTLKKEKVNRKIKTEMSDPSVVTKRHISGAHLEPVCWPVLIAEMLKGSFSQSKAKFTEKSVTFSH